MKRFANLQQLQDSGLLLGMLATVRRVLSASDEDPDSIPNTPQNGSVYLLQSCDIDASIAEVFGAGLTDLPFNQVRYHPDDERFLCSLARDSGGQALLVIPDAYWLDDGWRAWLLSQL